MEYGWEAHSACQCRSCDYRGLVGDFQGKEVDASFCQRQLLGETSHPRIGTVYALMRQAALRSPGINGLYIDSLGLQFMVSDFARYPLPDVDISLMSEVVNDKTLRGKTFYFMPKGGVPTESMAVLSTGHLSLNDRSILMDAFSSDDQQDCWLIGAQREEGFLVYTNVENCPLPSLHRVLEAMLNAGFVWVLFDVDGEYVDGLAIYE